MAGHLESAAKRPGVCRRVLVVDDERTIAEVVSRYLERADTKPARPSPDRRRSGSHIPGNPT